MLLNMLLNKILIRRYDEDEVTLFFYVLNPSNKINRKEIKKIVIYRE